MPIFRKGGHAIHFAHVPRTGGRALVKAVTKAGWFIDYTGRNRNTHPHLMIHEYDESIKEMPSFAVVRDPVSRFISACKFEGLCKSQDEVVEFLNESKSIPEIEERHFNRQVDFIAPHTKIFKYEEDMENLYEFMEFAGLLKSKDDVTQFNPGSYEFEFNVEEFSSSVMKLRVWYLSDYKRFGYID